MERGETLTLQLRLTHRYRRAYADLDEHEFLGDATIIEKRSNFLPKKPWRVVEFFVLDCSNVTEKEEGDIAQAIYDTLRERCACEHDCCHWQKCVGRVRRMRDNKFAFVFINERNN